MTTPVVGSARVRILPDFGDFSNLVRGGIESALTGIASAAISATAALTGLGAALSKIGLEQANVLQSGEIAFEALAAEIAGVNRATSQFGDAQRAAISSDFIESLRIIARETSITLQNLIFNSQALLALGNSGEVAKNTILTVGNALAASGKSGADLNKDLNGVIIAFGQIQGAGRLLAQDINQITTRIPAATRELIRDEIAENIGLIGDKTKATTIELIKARIAVEKLQEAGQISADLGVASILAVLQEIPGAVDDGVASALKRVNEQTLSGSFEELKDRFKQELGNAFLGAADNIVPQLNEFSTRIDGLVGNFAGPLATLMQTFTRIIVTNADAISTGLGNFFTAMSNALIKLEPHIPAIVRGIGDFFRTIKDIATSTTVGTVIRTIGDAFKYVKENISKLEPLVTPLTSVFEGLGRIVLNLEPVLTGFIDGLVASGPNLESVATAINNVADSVKSVLDNGVGEFIGYMLSIAAQAGAITLGAVALAAVATSIRAITAAMIANPFGAIVFAISFFVLACVEGWRTSEKFREIVVNSFYFVARGVTGYVVATLYALEKLAFGIDAVIDKVKKIPGLGTLLGLGNIDQVFDTAAVRIRQARTDLVNLVESIKTIDTTIEKSLTKEYPAPKVPKPAKSTPNKPADSSSAFAIRPPTVDLNAQRLLEQLREQERLAKEAAAAIKRAVEASISDINSIRKNIEDKNLDTLREQFVELYGHLHEANRDFLITIAKGAQIALEQQIKARDKVQEALATAKSDLEALRSEADAFRDSIEAAITAMGNVTEPPKGIRTTIAGITNNLTNAIKTAGEFKSSIERLQTLGLNQDSLRQIITAGPEAGLAAAKALAKAGSDGVNRVNKLQNDLASVSDAFGRSMYDSFYASGVSAAEGLVAGLESKEAAIKLFMQKIADGMVNELKSKLEINSPSKLMEREIQGPILAGIIPNQRLVSQAMNEMTNGVRSTSGRTVNNSITVPVTVQGAGIPDRNRAQTMGDTLANIIAHRQNALALEGMA